MVTRPHPDGVFHVLLQTPVDIPFHADVDLVNVVAYAFRAFPNPRIACVAARKKKIGNRGPHRAYDVIPLQLLAFRDVVCHLPFFGRSSSGAA